MILYQTALFPVLVSYSFLIVASLFRNGSLVKNVGILLLLIAPALISFFVLIIALNREINEDGIRTVCQMIFGLLLGAGLVAIGFQIWTRWTLVSFQQGAAAARTSISSLIELTTIMAVAFAIAVSLAIGQTGMLVAMILFAALGVLSAITIISAVIGYLSKPKHWLALAIWISIASVASLWFSVGIARFEYGWTFSTRNAVLVLAASLYGTVLMLAMQGVCLRWLRACGWRCVR